MPRSVQSMDGLALQGSATVAGLSLRTPEVAVTAVPGATGATGPSGTLVLTTGPPTEPGRRSAQLGSGGQSLVINFPIPAPEVSGIPGALVESAPGVWVVHAPLAPEEWTALGAARPELVVLGNARTLFNSGSIFEETIRDLRDRVGPAPILWAPRVALPHRLAFLAYVGVDLLDTTEGRWKTTDGKFLDATLGDLDPAAAVREGACGCSDCAAGGPPQGAHVAAQYAQELARVRTAIASHRLRELVESREVAEPALAEHLRYADRILGPLLEERTAVVGTELRGYVHRESLRRPEVSRFLLRLKERYRPPPAKELLLLLPCSKTKPYRLSPSHRRYWGALEGLPYLSRVHVVSVTSPLGLVPRELEDVHPARHYDIPVTGDWDEEERRRVLDLLRHLLSTGHYRAVVHHLDPEEYGFLKGASDQVPSVWSAPDEHTLSREALGALRAAVAAGLEGTSPAAGGPLAVVREELREIAAVQFGRDAAERLFAPPVRLAGRPWFQRLVDGSGTDLASWREERGLFQLTVAGARRMSDAHSLEVEVAPEVPLEGDLFCPGVVRADPAIRVGDAVTLVRSGSVVAVGEAELPGRLMTGLGRGRAVEVRHRARSATPGHSDDPLGA